MFEDLEAQEGDAPQEAPPTVPPPTPPPLHPVRFATVSGPGAALEAVEFAATPLAPPEGTDLPDRGLCIQLGAVNLRAARKDEGGSNGSKEKEKASGRELPIPI